LELQSATKDNTVQWAYIRRFGMAHIGGNLLKLVWLFSYLNPFFFFFEEEEKEDEYKIVNVSLKM
jgi:hypothetical protein